MFKHILKSFIKTSISSFIKIISKEFIQNITDEATKNFSKSIIKFLAKILSNLLTYAFTQYLIKLIIKKITKTAKKFIRITVFKHFIKKGIKLFSKRVSKPFIHKVNLKTKMMIHKTKLVSRGKALIKKLGKVRRFKKMVMSKRFIKKRLTVLRTKVKNLKCVMKMEKGKDKRGIGRRLKRRRDHEERIEYKDNKTSIQDLNFINGNQFSVKDSNSFNKLETIRYVLLKDMWIRTRISKTEIGYFEFRKRCFRFKFK